MPPLPIKLMIRIGAYALADQRRRLIRFRRNRLESLIHYLLEERVIRDIGGQQQFQLAAQVVIVTASLRQKGRPVGRREVRGFVKQEFDAVPSIGSHGIPTRRRPNDSATRLRPDAGLFSL